MKNNLTVQIKDTIANLVADGKTRDEIRAFLLQNNIEVGDADIAKLAPERPPSPGDEQPIGLSHFDTLVATATLDLEGGHTDEDVKDSLLKQIENNPDPVAYANRILNCAKINISNTIHAQKVEDYAKQFAKKEKAVVAVIEPIHSAIDKLLPLIDKAIKVKREHGSSFSRLINAKRELTRIRKSVA